MPKQMTKNEFRRYLEKSGVVDVLEEMLVALYDEPNKPSNAMDFMRSYIGVNSDDTEKAAAIAENAELKKENEALKEKLNTAEAPAVDAAQTAAKDAPESAAPGADATQPEPEPGPEPETKPEPGPETEPDTEPEPGPEPEPETQPEPQPQPQPQPQPEPQPEPEPEPEPESEPVKPLGEFIDKHVMHPDPGNRADNPRGFERLRRKGGGGARSLLR